ncbi:MAG TPA: EamA family transporter RarD [Candidatus Dormibacteraeota bacterium]|nr:EamA family transporter RarD [Candidatus Dormibacteraeota bacterium]
MSQTVEPVAKLSNSAEIPRTKRHVARRGLFCALGAYVGWGFIPLYFRAVSEVPPFIVLCHRICWSVLFLVGVVTFKKEWSSIWKVVRDRRSMVFLSAGAALIASNWLLFIYAVTTHQLLQASLGYFINPLLSIALGMIFLKEKLRGWQWFAVALAALAVANLAVQGRGFPWLALSLALTFGFYGLVRKKVNIDSLRGLLVETAILLPMAVVVLALPSAPGVTGHMLGLLSLSGVFTAVPLLLFGVGVRELKLSTLGFLQYAGPTLQFLVALLIFREPLAPAKLGSFGLCWAAIAVYAADSIINRVPQPLVDEPD